MAKLSINGVVYDFCEQAHESDACLPSSLELSKEQVKYMGVSQGNNETPIAIITIPAGQINQISHGQGTIPLNNLQQQISSHLRKIWNKS